MTAIVLPNDIQESPTRNRPARMAPCTPASAIRAPKIVPRDAELDRAAEVLNAGKKVAMLIGAGALGASDEVIAVADKLSAGCAKALLGKAALPDDLPWVTGSIGLLGTEPSYNMMMECDTLLMIGSAFPYSEFLPKEGEARGVQIDIDAGMLSIRFPMEVGLVGDAAETLRALLPRLRQKADGSLAQEASRTTSRMVEDAGEPRPAAGQYRSIRSASTWELSPRLPERAIITSDSAPAPTGLRAT